MATTIKCTSNKSCASIQIKESQVPTVGGDHPPGKPSCRSAVCCLSNVRASGSSLLLYNNFTTE